MIFKQLFLIFLLLTLAETTPAQFFERVYGGNNVTTGSYFDITADHGVIVAGNSRDSVTNLSAYYLMKTDVLGNPQWVRTEGDLFNAFSHSVVALTDSTVVLLGTHEGVVYQNSAEILVFDSSGNLLSERVYPPSNGWGTAGVGLIPTSDSTVMFSLFNDGFISNNYYSLFSLKPDLSSDWNDFLGFDGSFTTAQGLSMSGNYIYSVAFYDIYFYTPNALMKATSVKKHAPDGTLLLDSVYEFGYVVNAIEATLDGGAILCGVQDSAIHRDITVTRIDTSGHLIWQRQYGSGADEEAVAILETSDSEYVILAMVNDSILAGQRDLMLLKLNQAGDSLWCKYFGGVYDEQALHLEKDGSDLVIMGSTNSFGNDRIYLARTDSSGSFQAAFEISANGRYHCMGDTVQLNLIPQPPLGSSIVWSNGDTTPSTGITSTGNFSAQIIVQGDTSVTAFYSVYFAALPVANLGGDTLSLCQGMEIRNITNPELTYSYEWLLDGIPVPGEFENFIIPNQPGSYQLVVTNYCSADTATLFVDSIFTLPQSAVVTAPLIDFVCAGDSLRLAATVSDTSLMFQWNTTDFSNLSPITGANDSVFYANEGGFYVVEVMDVNGCKANSLPYFVQFDRAKEVINLNGPSIFCQGGQVGLSVGPGSGFSWSTGDTTASIIVNSGGNYYVTFTNTNGCQKNSDTISITVLNNPAVNLGNDTAVCAQQSVMLDAGSGFNNYLWSSGQTSQIITASSTGPYPDTNIYIVFITDTSSCTGRDTIQIIFDLCSAIVPPVDKTDKIFPNPINKNGQLSVECSSCIRSTIRIYDVSGRMLLDSEIPTNGRISLQGLLPGMYVCRLGHFTSESLHRLIIH